METDMNHPINIELPNTGFLRLPEVLKVVPIARTTWFEWVERGKAPIGKKFSPKITAYRVNDIKRLIKILDEESSELYWKASNQKLKEKRKLEAPKLINLN